MNGEALKRYLFLFAVQVFILCAQAPDSHAARWKNWTGNVISVPVNLASPKTLPELQALVRDAKQVRAVGSGHSFNASTACDQLLIKMDHLNKILSLDPVGMEVTVEAGMRLHDLSVALWNKGLAVPSSGDIDEQSIAGLVSTGTHGSAMRWGSFSDEGMLRGLELVLPDGTTRTLRADRLEDRTFFEAARVSFGSLGVISKVTLRVMPAHHLEWESRVVTIGEALKPEHYLTHDHYEFFILPFTGKAQAIFRDITSKPPTQGVRIKQWFNRIFIEGHLLGAVLNATRLRPSLIPKVWNTLAKLTDQGKHIDRSYRIMSTRRLFPFYELEFALPIENAVLGVQAIIETIEHFASLPRDQGQYFYNLPVEVRFMRADQGTMLSPAQGRDTCYIDLSSHTGYHGWQPFFKEVERRLLALGGRPHWGKQFYRNPTALYPRFDQWNRLRQEVDPDGKFMNEFTRQIVAGSEITDPNSKK